MKHRILVVWRSKRFLLSIVLIFYVVLAIRGYYNNKTAPVPLDTHTQQALMELMDRAGIREVDIIAHMDLIPSATARTGDYIIEDYFGRSQPPIVENKWKYRMKALPRWPLETMVSAMGFRTRTVATIKHDSSAVTMHVKNSYFKTKDADLAKQMAVYFIERLCKAAPGRAT